MADIEINPTSFVDTIQFTVKDTDGTEDEVRHAGCFAVESCDYAVSI